MAISPRLTAALAFLALLPVGVYAFASGQQGPLTAAIGVINVLLIAASLMLMFGPTDNGSSNGTAAN
jgi:uncharacterized membrane protein